MSDLQELNNKKIIRSEMIKKRAGLMESEVQRCSSLIIDQLKLRVEYHQARTMLAYVPFRNEIDISTLLREWLEAGKVLLLPVTDWEQRLIHPVQIKRFPEDLVSGPMGIPEPAFENPNAAWSLEEIDLVLVPGVAFDFNGNRLGYGQGFYDRLLVRVPDRVSIIGLAYSFQVVDTIYPQPHDFRLPVIITEYKAVVDREKDI